MEKTTEIKVGIPATLIEYEGEFFIMTNEISEKIIGSPIFISAKTLAEAEIKFLEMLEFVNKYHSQRSIDLDKWKLFQKGNWSHTGGTWFTMLGIHVYLRYGKGMKGGWYIPLTKLNISVNNMWKKRKPHAKSKVVNN